MLRELIPADLAKLQSTNDWKRYVYKQITLVIYNFSNFSCRILKYFVFSKGQLLVHTIKMQVNNIYLNLIYPGI